VGMKSYKDLENYQLNFINDTHEINDNEFKYFQRAYDELGRKINRFNKYVGSEWK
jgi:hypothetical protein